MKKMLRLVLVIGIMLSVVGCNQKRVKDDGQGGSQPTTVTPPDDGDFQIVNYGGLVEGCKAVYNPLYCPDQFRPGSLNADKPTALFRDEDGNLIVLDPETSAKMKVVLEDNNISVEGDRVWHKEK